MVVEGAVGSVEGWKVKGQNGQRGKEKFVLHSQWNQSEWLWGPLSSIFLCATRMPRWVVKVLVQRGEEGKGSI